MEFHGHRYTHQVMQTEPKSESVVSFYYERRALEPLY